VNASLANLLIQQERKDPKRPYIRGQFGQVSYAEALRRVTLLSQLLASSGHVSDQRSIGISTQAPEAIVYTVWAGIFSGISVVFLPACSNPQMMRGAMQQAAVDALLTDDPALLQQPWCLDLREVLQPVLSGQGGIQSRTLSIRVPATLPPERAAGFVFQTSGTAGEPKWIRCEYRQFAMAIDCMLRAGALDHARGQTVFLTPPLYHSYGLSTFLEYTAVGGTLILPQGASPLGPVGELMDAAIRDCVTAIEGVPYFYSQLAKLAERLTVPALSHLGLGGGGVDHIAFEKLRQVYPAITVSVRYGLTETPSVVSHKVFRPPFREDWRSSGHVLPVYQVEIIGAAGRILGKNQEGEISVSGPCVGAYLGQSGGRLLTGDTGYLTHSGELIITGRKSLFIKNRGFRVSPEQVESVICSLAGVRDCRVLMIDSRFVAEVVHDDSLSQRDILSFMSARLPGYAVVDKVVSVERVARTASGKVKRYL
jgi:acyl-coenzyme A synthetase/AMP-(fatty) acid ligase